jgi:hypothetical protein
VPQCEYYEYPYEPPLRVPNVSTLSTPMTHRPPEPFVSAVFFSLQLFKSIGMGLLASRSIDRSQCGALEDRRDPFQSTCSSTRSRTNRRVRPLGRSPNRPHRPCGTQLSSASRLFLRRTPATAVRRNSAAVWHCTRAAPSVRRFQYLEVQRAIDSVQGLGCLISDGVIVWSPT